MNQNRPDVFINRKIAYERTNIRDEFGKHFSEYHIKRDLTVLFALISRYPHIFQTLRMKRIQIEAGDNFPPYYEFSRDDLTFYHSYVKIQLTDDCRFEPDSA